MPAPDLKPLIAKLMALAGGYREGGYRPQGFEKLIPYGKSWQGVAEPLLPETAKYSKARIPQWQISPLRRFGSSRDLHVPQAYLETQHKSEGTPLPQPVDPIDILWAYLSKVHPSYYREYPGAGDVGTAR